MHSLSLSLVHAPSIFIAPSLSLLLFCLSTQHWLILALLQARRPRSRRPAYALFFFFRVSPSSPSKLVYSPPFSFIFLLFRAPLSFSLPPESFPFNLALFFPLFFFLQFRVLVVPASLLLFQTGPTSLRTFGSRMFLLRSDEMCSGFILNVIHSAVTG